MFIQKRIFLLLTSAFMLFLLAGACQNEKETGQPDQQLDYTTSWLGNTLPGSEGWVIQAVDDIFVTSDGTVYTNVVWDEHGGNVSAFKEGEFVAEARVGNHGGGNTITANADYIYFAGNEYRTGNQGIDRRDRKNIHDKSANVHVDAGRVFGLVATGSRVYAGVPGEDKIKVYDQNLNYKSAWSVDNPGELALDKQGQIWMIQDSSKILHFSPEGKKLPQAITFPQGVIATDITVDPQGRLLVTDIGVKEQIRIYTNIASDPAFAGTFGVEKGVYAGPTPGKKGPRRLYKPMGVGVDAVGNIYVGNKAGYHENGATLIQSYHPDGSLNWEMEASLWIDVVDVDPENENILYGSGERFSMDYTKSRGQEANLEAYTTNRHWFPKDKRNRGATWMRMIGGEKIMFLSSMSGLPINIYRFEPATHGEVVIPSGRLSSEKLWTDKNGNGLEDPGETESQNLGGGQCAWVDSEGTIWHCNAGGINRFPLQGFNRHGVPEYTTNSAAHYDPPGNFTELRRIRFYPERNNMMILNGFTGEYSNISHHFKRAGKVFRRYDNWQPGNWHVTWQLVPSFEDRETGNSGDGNVQAISVAGDYLFFARNGSSPNLGYKRGHISIYELETKDYVGWMEPAPIIASGNPNEDSFTNIGIIDIVDGMNAYQRSNGEYLIFLEDDWNSKNILYRWCPSGNCSENTNKAKQQ